jgi:hypothetical protein
MDRRQVAMDTTARAGGDYRRQASAAATAEAVAITTGGRRRGLSPAGSGGRDS